MDSFIEPDFIPQRSSTPIPSSPEPLLDFDPQRTSTPNPTAPPDPLPEPPVLPLEFLRGRNGGQQCTFNAFIYTFDL